MKKKVHNPGKDVIIRSRRLEFARSRALMTPTRARLKMLHCRDRVYTAIT